MIDYIQQLKNLRGKLANGFMSLMVGSGFSKNVHPSFPDWREMIFDMADELYGFEIRQSFPPNLTEQEKSVWIRDAVLRKIEREGYLKVVSAYIRLKGIEEAVVSYIEARTPIIQEGNQYMLLIDGEKKPLTPAHLELHRMLVHLPWNNIYTTNYDPLLECCVDMQEFEELQAENRVHAERSVECADRLHRLELAREELSKKHQIIRDQNQGKAERGEQLDPQDDKKNWEEIIAIDNEMSDLRAARKDAEDNIRINENYMQHSYTLVKSGSELSVKKNKNIIKLHGSLRSREQRERHEYGFDGDPRKQYVISEEHYFNYPRFHEAFTQLMRISLLQESFCLIGFSGVDPNFLSWIDWVRDLLQRSRSAEKNNRDYKIYFLDLNAEESSAEQLLYFENHRIVRIPLLSKEVIQFLETEANKAVDTDKLFSSVLEVFFHYLEDHPGIVASTVRPAMNRPEKEWEKLWKVTTGNGHNFEGTQNGDLEWFHKLDELFPKLSFPQFNKTNYHSPLGFLIHLTGEGIDELDEDKRNAVLRLALRVLEYYKSPIAFVVRREIVERLLRNDFTRGEAIPLSYRNNTLTAPDTMEDTLTELPLTSYEQILRAAYSLQYALLMEKLTDWQPGIEELHLKAGFMCWYDSEVAEKTLEQQLQSDKITEQQRLHSMEMLSMVKRSRAWQIDKRLEKKIEQYERAGYYSISDNFSFFEKELLPKPVKVMPYGNDRYMRSIDESEEGGRIDVYARQNLMLLAESGFPAHLFYMNVQTPDHWYRLFKRLFRDFPFPCIYYILQYNDEDLVRRAAQDICFTEGLPHDIIIKRLMAGYKSVPSGQQEGLLLFLAELMGVVKPTEWQKEFLEIWRSLRAGSPVTSLTEKPVDAFVRAGLRFIEDAAIVSEIINDLLHLLPALLNKVIAHLYYLNANTWFRKLGKLAAAPKLKMTLENIIGALPQYDGDYFFLLGNLYFLLEPNHFQQISNALHQLDLNKIKTAGVWRIVLHFVKDDDHLRESIKKTLQHHESLWQTGIHGKSYHSHTGMLRLSELTKSDAHPKGLEWSQDEVLNMYNKMKPSLEDLVRVFEKEMSFMDFTREWEQMAWFLDYHKQFLEQQPDFQTVSETVKYHMEQLHGYSEVNEGIYIDTPSSELDALLDLSERIETKRATTKSIGLIIDKLLMRAGSRVEEGLEYLSRWLRDRRNDELFENFIPDLIILLKQYRTRPLKEADVAFVENQLVIIALALNDRDCNDAEIGDWIKMAEKSWFNATRQRLWLYHQKRKQQEELM